MTALDNRFAARASALGYAYQFRYALKRALQSLSTGYDWTVAIEAADDIEVTGPGVNELTQLKQTGRPLTNASPDLWKTLRIWSDGVASGQIDPATCTLYLVTTASVGSSSVASLLGYGDGRSEIEAEQILLNVCDTSDNTSNRSSYCAFSALPHSLRIALLRSMQIIPNELNVSEIKTGLESAVRVGMRKEHIPAFIERLEGWWFERCLGCLASRRPRITAEEVDSFVHALRDQFRPDNLPIDHDIALGPDPSIETFRGRTFVKQATLTCIRETRIQMAVRDYLRAFSQRSRWSRQSLVDVEELQRYEHLLKEEWEMSFERLCEDLTADAAEDERVQVAKKVYEWVESAAVVPIRMHCIEPFVKRGSYHMLADELYVGWHPDFKARLGSVGRPE